MCSSALTHRLNRLLHRGPPRHYRGPEVPSILRDLSQYIAAGDDAIQAAAGLPALPETYLLPVRPVASASFTIEADALLAGEFRPGARWKSKPLGFPPPWDADPFEDRNWCSLLHSLEWLIPLVHAHVGAPDRGYLQASVRAVDDWIWRNPFRRAPSRFSWHDHAAAKRLRLFAWFWELYRESDDFDLDFARLLLASVYQHVLYHLDDRNYRPNSNHGLEGIGALFAAAIAFPSFRDASDWEAKARERLTQWLADNLSPEGFHLEQSPSYHWFVLLRLAAIDRFLRANGRAVEELSEATERAAGVWPYLLKPNGAIPTVGDSSHTAPADWRALLERQWGRRPPSPVSPSAAPDETRTSTILVSPRAGYAILASEPPPYSTRDATYVLFRCRTFESPHFHHDALSLVLFGLGRDWIVDPGYLNYDEADPRRQHLRSLRAHSLVIIPGTHFRTGPNDCLEWGITPQGISVSAYHDLPTARHTRRILLPDPSQLLVQDHLEWVRRRPVPWVQLFQLAPDLEVEIISDRETRLIAPEGTSCLIRQSSPGAWRVARGEERPALQGWFSESYGKWNPGITLAFHVPLGVSAVRSQLQLVRSDATP